MNEQEYAQIWEGIEFFHNSYEPFLETLADMPTLSTAIQDDWTIMPSQQGNFSFESFSYVYRIM